MATANNLDWIRALHAGSERFGRVIDDGAPKTHALGLIAVA